MIITHPPAGPPAPPEENGRAASPLDGRGKDGRDFRVRAEGGIVGRVYGLLADYVALPEGRLLVVSVWVVAAWLADLWDRFPHLCVYSPEKRCGKTLLLELLEKVTPGGKLCVHTSGPALFRTLALPDVAITLLLDEAQSLNRKGSESNEALRDIFCGGISRGATVSRCVGPNHIPTDFPIYCPKVFAYIGPADHVLGDRCLPNLIERVTKEERRRLGLKKYRYRAVQAALEEIHGELCAWAAENKERVREIYDGVGGAGLEPFDVENDRLADLEPIRITPRRGTR
jgi:hypothetical protein